MFVRVAPSSALFRRVVPRRPRATQPNSLLTRENVETKWATSYCGGTMEG